MAVSLNIDLGELDDEPPELVGLATVVNVACGGHAGSEDTVRRTLERAVASGGTIAAHPSYPDRAGFGRTPRFSSSAEAAAAVRAQCALLARIAGALGVRVGALKLHGALYHDAAADPDLGRAVLAAARAGLGELTVVLGPAGPFAENVAAQGARLAREGFCDRGYRDGRLLPRGEPGALLDDPAACAAQALALARAGDVDTLCVHGDRPGAVARARAVRDALERAGLLA